MHASMYAGAYKYVRACKHKESTMRLLYTYYYVAQLALLEYYI